MVKQSFFPIKFPSTEHLIISLHTLMSQPAHDPMIPNQTSTESLIMAALSALSPPQLSDLTQSISSLFHCHRRRLFTLLSSPTLFSLTLCHLQSLSLHHKSILIARHLLSNLTLLKHFMQKHVAVPPPYSSSGMKLRDLDAVLLLLVLCELHKHDQELLETPPSRWRVILCDYLSNTVLKLSSFGSFSTVEDLIAYIEMLAKCRNFVNVMGCGGELGKEGKEVAASTAAVVALPSVEVSGGECVICKEEIKEGREVCELPCSHYFHWMCILRWLKKRNTCPCCRYQLPTDNVLHEIDRIFKDLTKMGSEGEGGCGGGVGGLYQECLCT